ncbi:MAG: TlpA family protein disulfide reductase [Alistipes sp.]|nr:TlpA family protein disulfide reductase [Alistipes sp.]
MKRFSTIMIALIICACSGNQTKNQQTDATIHCHINGVVHDRPESSKLLLYIGVDGNIAVSSQPYCEIKISDSQFSYDLYLNEPQYCELVFEDEFKNGYWQAIDFIADDGAINMNLYPTEEVGKTDIEGPASTTEYQSYKVELRKLQDTTNEVRNKLKAEGKTYTEEYSSLITQIEALENNSPKQKQLIEQIQAMTEEQTYAPETLAERKRYQAERLAKMLEIVTGEPSTARLAMLAKQMKYKLPPQELIDAFNNIYAVKMPDNAITKFCLRQIEGFQLQIGAQYIDFEAPDLDGQMHKLSDMIKDAEVILLDLWASWCGPCRTASIEMIPLYDKYHNKGFQIIGVARESGSTKAMEKAVKQDGYKWPQLVELDDRANIWAKYGCNNAAGRRILFDVQGKIIAFDPTIEQLTAEVEKRINK